MGARIAQEQQPAAPTIDDVRAQVTFRREGPARSRTIRLTAAPEKPGAQPSAPSALSDPVIWR
jgi:hypothetical protein